MIKIGNIRKMSNISNIIFVLGGPGSGKSTLCKKLVENGDYYYLSAGDVLRRERELNIGSKHSKMINDCISQGKIVPGIVTTKLLINECLKCSNNSNNSDNDNKTILIDGFPRSEENYDTWYSIVPNNLKTKGVLLFECDEDVLINRILNRAKKSLVVRVDDNIETVKNRLKVYNEQTIPVTKKFEDQGKLFKVNCNNSIDNNYNNIEEILKEL